MRHLAGNSRSADLAKAAPCSPRSARVSAQATNPAAHGCPLHMSLLASWNSLLAAAMLPCKSGIEGEWAKVEQPCKGTDSAAL